MRNRRKILASGRVIASRVLNEVGGSFREISVSFEEPRQQSGGDWVCRFLIKGLGRLQTHRAWGVDSLQALLLAVDGARVTLENTLSRFSWVESDPDKAGSGIPRYIPTEFGPRLEARVNVAIEREYKGYYQRILRNRKANIAAFEAEVKERRDTLVLLENLLARRKAGVADWETELKNWKPEKTRRIPS